ncbi:MAG: hypothetical protein PHC88_08160 [Terrimicrobiaceae bacterium]|nr:hypothetical protein [Terrimicrobiaceae bacterium]
MTVPSARDRFAREALRWIPKILTLQDRNRHSPTYGCFDRNYWQYKIIDFPSGMAQEFTYPLALAWACGVEGNAFHGQAALRDWAEAGMVFAARSAHADASCDDYFPYEKAGGAAAFSLLACAESYKLLGLQNCEVLQFFERRANWLAHHNESGQLTNHQALIVRCFDCVGDLLGSDQWAKARQQRLDRVLAWQNAEGWFQEYEGCDPGYHTLTISLLAEIYERTPTPGLRDSLARAVALAAEFVHPDGSFGGEYASRNTYNFFPHGFELFGRHDPSALAINDRCLAGIAAGLGPCHADDHIVGHHTWNYLLAWRDFVPERPAKPPRAEGRAHFPNAGLLIDRRGGAELYVALNKGGVFKFFRDGKLVASDTQVSLVLKDRKSRNAVAHLVGDYPHEIEGGRIAVRGEMGWAKQKKMTPFNLIVLRLIMLGGGRFFPDLIRKLLQKLLITGRKPAPFRFEREFVWDDGRLTVHDRVEPTGNGDWKAVRQAGIGCDQTSIYVVMSRTFQAGQMLPWIDLTERVAKLRPGGALEITRSL